MKNIPRILLGIIFVILPGLKLEASPKAKDFCVLRMCRKFRTTETFNPTLDSLNAATLTPCANRYQDASIKKPSAPEVIKELKNGNEVNINFNGTSILAQQSIKVPTHGETLFICSRGYGGSRPFECNAIQGAGAGLHSAARYIRDNIITAPCIAFDYPDDRKKFNFAQEADQQSLETIYDAVIQKAPNKKIVLFGSCRGATNILHTVARIARNNPERLRNVKGLILESPPLSLEAVTQQIGKQDLAWLPGGGTILHKVFKFIFPAHDPDKDHSLADVLADIPTDVPILITHLKGHDAVVSDNNMKTIIESLQRKNVYLHIVDKPTAKHGFLGHLSSVQEIANAFLKEHQLPHKSALAIQGKRLLENAQDAAQYPNTYL